MGLIVDLRCGIGGLSDCVVLATLKNSAAIMSSQGEPMVFFEINSQALRKQVLSRYWQTWPEMNAYCTRAFSYH